MSTSLFTGLSGLRSFETYLDVIGNNIANANTTGFRAGRVTFGDLLSITISPGAAPSATVGGVNPAQIGLGVGVKSIDLNTNSGSLLATDRNLDLTVFGPGFFVVNNGQRNLFTRAGTFGFDASGQLVEVGTGFLVQSTTNSSIVVPPTAIAPPQETTEVTLKGNLPAKVTGPLPEILSTNDPFQTGTAASITGTNTGPFALTDGDSLSIQVDGGPPQTVTFTAADFTALGGSIGAATATEVASVINAQISGATASASAGAVVLESDSIGTGSKLKLTDISGGPAFNFGLSTVLKQGTQQAAAGSDDLNDLVSTITDYVSGDGIEVRGSDKDGNEFAATFTYGVDGTTLDDLKTFLDGLVPGADVTLDTQGNLVMTADESGEAKFTLTLEDTTGNTGGSDFSQVAFITTQDGTDPDAVNTAITIYDTNGEGHVLSLTFLRVDSTTWSIEAALPDADGTIIDGTVGDIRFGNDGALVNAGGPGDDDPNIEIQFSTGSQTIELDLGSPNTIDGITQFGGPATAQAIQQDGFASGTLADVVVTEDGTVSGVFTNGQTQDYGQIALASFSNPGGLRREGNNLFSDSVNSGVALIGSGGGPGGSIQAGVLETSNVDLAEEFVRMIEAQRAYQASARIIRASEEMLNGLLQNI